MAAKAALAAAKIASNKKVWIIGGTALAVVAIILVIYFAGKKAGNQAKPKPLKIPNAGTDIPTNWSAVPTAVALEDELSSFWYVDDTVVLKLIQPLTKGQLAAVYNEYGNRYGKDLIEDIKKGLSGNDLQTALNLFNGII